MVTIEYAWEHNGHEVGSKEDMARSMLPRRVTEWINERVEEGLDWRLIKPLLRLDSALLDHVSQSCNFPIRLNLNSIGYG
jgi:hypothetical protein